MSETPDTTNTAAAVHALDNALVLHANAAGDYTGTTSPAYWNMVGPFGGVTAATLMQAVLQHPQRLGDPVAFTINYASALAAGPYRVIATPVRTNRSTQHWTISLTQNESGEPGGEAVVCTATALTAQRRSTWSTDDVAMPQVPPPGEVAPAERFKGVEWISRYELRAIAGAIPAVWDGSGTGSLTQMWVRDAPARPLDFASLTAMSDIFFPRVWLRRSVQVPVGTVSMTVYFHAGPAEFAATGSGYLLAQAQAQSFRNGFFDHSGQLWNEAGTLLVTTHQVVYFKE